MNTLQETFATPRLAIDTPYIRIENPPGSGHYIKEDLAIAPNITLTLEEKQVKYYFYDRNTKGVRFNKNNMGTINFNADKETIFVVHGWVTNYKMEMPQSVKDAYLKSRDVNVIIVDWSEISFRDYVNAKFAVKTVGKIISGLIEFMIANVNLQMDKTGFVGHSLGAHVSGVAGAHLNGSIDHLIGKN